MTKSIKVNAEPTKDFFISMLTKDIDLKRSIIDLVDNCIDGARRIKPDSDYNGLRVNIIVTPDKFTISDNCGGIELDTATNYAFRFGRPSDAPSTLHSVGLFGVGMKRAIFKMGNEFTVESMAETSSFKLTQDIEKWKSEEDWLFEFSEHKEGLSVPTNETSTTISVESLHPSVAADFSEDEFCQSLGDAIGEAQARNLHKGLTISINDVKIEKIQLSMGISETVIPAVYNESLDVSGNEVKVRIMIGVANPNPNLAGWYIFCNDRLVVQAEQTDLTGWRSHGIPGFHNDYARFRGYLCFEADEPKSLPWNTTKTGLDWGAGCFRSIKPKMMNLMKQTTDFLKQLRREKEDDNANETPLQDGVDESNLRLKDVFEISEFKDLFTYPVSTAKSSRSTTRRIQYVRPIKEVQLVMEALEVDTLKEVGEETFNYFLERECCK